MAECDIGIIVPLIEEFRVLSSVFPITSTESYDGISYYTLNVGDLGIQLRATVLGDMGKTLASQLTEKFINYVSPKVIILLGIAGAIDKNMKLGDVVVASEINEFQANSKAVPRGKSFILSYSGNHWKTDFAFVQCATNLEFSDPSLYQEWREQTHSFRNGLGMARNQQL